MISYEPFWKTIKDRDISSYKLINTYNFSKGTISRLKHNKHVTTRTLEDICVKLNVSLTEVLVYKKDKK